MLAQFPKCLFVKTAPSPDVEGAGPSADMDPGWLGGMCIYAHTVQLHHTIGRPVTPIQQGDIFKLLLKLNTESATHPSLSTSALEPELQYILYIYLCLMDSPELEGQVMLSSL